MNLDYLKKIPSVRYTNLLVLFLLCSKNVMGFYKRPSGTLGGENLGAEFLKKTLNQDLKATGATTLDLSTSFKETLSGLWKKFGGAGNLALAGGVTFFTAALARHLMRSRPQVQRGVGENLIDANKEEKIIQSLGPGLADNAIELEKQKKHMLGRINAFLSKTIHPLGEMVDEFSELLKRDGSNDDKEKAEYATNLFAEKNKTLGELKAKLEALIGADSSQEHLRTLEEECKNATKDGEMLEATNDLISRARALFSEIFSQIMSKNPAAKGKIYDKEKDGDQEGKQLIDENSKKVAEMEGDGASGAMVRGREAQEGLKNGIEGGLVKYNKELSFEDVQKAKREAVEFIKTSFLKIWQSIEQWKKKIASIFLVLNGEDFCNKSLQVIFAEMGRKIEGDLEKFDERDPHGSLGILLKKEEFIALGDLYENLKIIKKSNDDLEIFIQVVFLELANQNNYKKIMNDVEFLLKIFNTLQFGDWNLLAIKNMGTEADAKLKTLQAFKKKLLTIDHERLNWIKSFEEKKALTPEDIKTLEDIQRGLGKVEPTKEFFVFAKQWIVGVFNALYESLFYTLSAEAGAPEITEMKNMKDAFEKHANKALLSSSPHLKPLWKEFEKFFKEKNIAIRAADFLRGKLGDLRALCQKYSSPGDDFREIVPLLDEREGEIKNLVCVILDSPMLSILFDTFNHIGRVKNDISALQKQIDKKIVATTEEYVAELRGYFMKLNNTHNGSFENRDVLIDDGLLRALLMGNAGTEFSAIFSKNCALHTQDKNMFFIETLLGDKTFEPYVNKQNNVKLNSLLKAKAPRVFWLLQPSRDSFAQAFAKMDNEAWQAFSRALRQFCRERAIPQGGER